MQKLFLYVLYECKRTFVDERRHLLFKTLTQRKQVTKQFYHKDFLPAFLCTTLNFHLRFEIIAETGFCNIFKNSACRLILSCKSAAKSTHSNYCFDYNNLIFCYTLTKNLA